MLKPMRPRSEKHEEFLIKYAENMGPIWTGVLEPKNTYRRTGRSAYVSGAPFQRLDFARKDGKGNKGAGIFVPPPLPMWDHDEGGPECRQALESDKQLFFIHDNLNEISPRTEAARDHLWEGYCKDCPVKKECFDWAMRYEEWGIWAGTTEWDRKQARKDSEVLEFGVNRITAGYKPYLGNGCADCGKPAKFVGGRCKPCSTKHSQMKRREIAKSMKAKGMTNREMIRAHVNLEMAKGSLTRWQRREIQGTARHVKGAIARHTKEIERWEKRIQSLSS